MTIYLYIYTCIYDQQLIIAWPQPLSLSALPLPLHPAEPPSARSLSRARSLSHESCMTKHWRVPAAVCLALPPSAPPRPPAHPSQRSQKRYAPTSASEPLPPPLVHCVRSRAPDPCPPRPQQRPALHCLCGGFAPRKDSAFVPRPLRHPQSPPPWAARLRGSRLRPSPPPPPPLPRLARMQGTL